MEYGSWRVENEEGIMEDGGWRMERRKSRASLILSFLIISSIFVSGCVPVMIGAVAGVAGAYVWSNGNLELIVNYSPDDLYAATREALDELNIFVERDRHDRFGSNISGRADDGRKVLIKVEGLAASSCMIRVRVGIWGDLEESQMVMNVILRNAEN